MEYSLGFEFRKSVKFEFLVLNIFSTIQLGSIIFTRYFSRHSSSLLSFRVFLVGHLWGVLLLGKNIGFFVGGKVLFGLFSDNHLHSPGNN